MLGEEQECGRGKDNELCGVEEKTEMKAEQEISLQTISDKEQSLDLQLHSPLLFLFVLSVLKEQDI